MGPDLATRFAGLQARAKSGARSGLFRTPQLSRTDPLVNVGSAVRLMSLSKFGILFCAARHQFGSLSRNFGEL